MRVPPLSYLEFILGRDLHLASCVEGLAEHVAEHAAGDSCAVRRVVYRRVGKVLNFQAQLEGLFLCDENLLSDADVNIRAIPSLVNAYDGVNVKLDKCGGVQEALRTIQLAKSYGMKIMLGCMVSSSVSVTAAAHLSPLVDYADLDGNLLIANDPYRGVRVENGKLVLPSTAGLGLVENPSDVS